MVRAASSISLALVSKLVASFELALFMMLVMGMPAEFMASVTMRIACGKWVFCGLKDAG